MSEITHYLVFAWVILMIGIFPSFATPRRAVLFVMLSGMLFLPEAMRDEVALGPLHFSKYHAINYAVLFGALLYDSESLWAGFPRRIDIPMVVYCLCPFFSTITNDPPPDGSSTLRDAFSQTWSQTVVFGIPYLMGRIYFCDRAGIRELALGFVMAATVYAPFCLYEVRMSPQLHSMIYGYAQHSFGQTLRFGGYRPMVFLPHGLAVGMFMVSGALIATWLWMSEGPRISNHPQFEVSAYLGRIALLLVPTAILAKSTGAILLGIAGGGVPWMSRMTKSRWWLLMLAAVAPTYVIARTTGAWSGLELVDSATNNIDADRAQSMEFRLQNENILINRALERPAWGWGGWGRNRVSNERGKDVSVTDGLWVIVLGCNGIIGLTALGGLLLLPVARFALLFPPATWSHRVVAPAVGCAVVLTLWTIDSLPNAMVLPIYLLIAGALAGLKSGDFIESQNLIAAQ